jgi:hypothetical protein
MQKGVQLIVGTIIYTDSQVSLSLFISLVLCFKGTMLVAGTMLLTVRTWASWSDRPFMVGHVEDELSLVISIKILLIAVLQSFQVLVVRFIVWLIVSLFFLVTIIEIAHIYVTTN